MTELISICGVSLTGYGLSAAAALLVLLAVMTGWSMKHGVTYLTAAVTGCLGVVLGWLVSRLVYVCASYDFYITELEAPRYALYFRDGGYSMLGMYLGLILAGWLAAKLCRASAAVLLDGMALGMGPAIVIARLAERGTTLGVGLPIDQGWTSFGILTETGDGLMHAVWAYEAIAAGIVTLAVIVSACGRKRRPGDMMLTFALVFSAFQVLLESFRDDGHMEVHMGIHIQQVICAVLLCLPIIVWAARAAKAGSLKKPLLILSMLLGLVFIGVAIVAEFGVDRWSSKLLAYGLMTGCLALLLVMGLWLRGRANKGV